MYGQIGSLSPNQRRWRQRVVKQISEESQLLMLLIAMMIFTHIQAARSYAIVPNPPMNLPERSYTVTSPPHGANQRIRYNIGASESETSDDVLQATQYWVEYESINEYPSPLNNIQAVVSSLEQDKSRNTHTEKKKKQHPPLIPSRLTDDQVFRIVAHSQQDEKAATLQTNDNNNVVKVIAHPNMRSGQSFDINTAWIELLIHEQQMKHLSSNVVAAANAAIAA